MTVLSELYLTVTVGCLVLAGVVVAKGPRSLQNWLCGLVLFFFAVFSFEDIFHYWYPPITLAQAKFFGRIGGIGGFDIPALALLFALVLSGRRRILRFWPLYIPVVGFPLLFNITAWLGIGAANYEMTQFGWEVTRAPSVLPVLYLVYYLSFVIVSLYLFARFSREAKWPRERKQGAIIFWTGLTSLLLGVTTDLILPQLTTVQVPKLAGAQAAIWAVGLAVSVTRYGLMTINPRLAADDILTTMLDALLLLSPEGNVVIVNQATLGLFGYGRGELAGKPAALLFHDPAQFTDTLGEVMCSGAVGRHEFICRTQAGRLIPVAATARVMLDSRGTPVGSVWVLRDVEQLRQAEQALRESEEKYRNLVERANDGIVIIQDQIVRYVNERMAAMLGQLPEKLLGTPFMNHVHGDALPQTLERYQRRMAGETVPATYESALRHRDGTRLPVELNAGLISYLGRPADLVMIRDITERKKSELAIEDSENRYRTLVEGSRDGVFTTDRAGRITFVNSEMLRRFAVPAHDFLDRPYVELAREPYRAALARQIAAVLAGEETDPIEVEFQSAIGGPIPVEVRHGALYLGNRISGLLGVARDLTERRRVEAALRASEERFEQVVDNAQEWIWETDVRGLYTYSSPIVLKILGYAPEDLVGKLHVHDLLGHENRDAQRQAALAVIDGRGPFRGFINRYVHRDGRTIWLTTSGVPILDADGKLTGYRGVHTDITEAKEAEEEIKAKSQRLENVNRALGQERMKLLAATEQLKNANDELTRLSETRSEFVASVSHDLRTPLTTIIEGITLTEDGSLGPLNDDQKQYLRYAREDAERLSELIDNLLDVAKIENGKMKVNPVKVDVGATITQIQTSFELYVQARGLSLSVMLPPEPLQAWCDAGHYHRVLANLLGNAIKYTPVGGTITIRAEQGEGNTIVTRVSDTGRGIPRTEQARIFGKFEQIRRTGDETMTGTGLGLAICKQLVELNGGTIRFESAEGLGSAFCFALPAFRAQSLLIPGS